MDGMLCKLCGWQEANHDVGDMGDGNPRRRRPGYSHTLSYRHHGFEPEDPELAEKLFRMYGPARQVDHTDSGLDVGG